MIKGLGEIDLNCCLFEKVVTHCSVNSEVTHEFLIEHLRIGEVVTCKSSTKIQLLGSYPVGG